MVLAMGKFQVSKYAAASQGGAGPLDFGLPTTTGNQFGGDGSLGLVPGNVFPQTIGPGGEIMPGGGGSPLPGGVPLDVPAYGAPTGLPFWDTSGMPGANDTTRGGFGSKILNVDLPKLVTAGQQFPIIVTYTHVGDNFSTYKVKITIPILQITETSPEKRVANGGRDSVVVSLTAPAPLPNSPITGTVELIQTEGNEVTIDSEVIAIPTDVVPNPPVPGPTPGGPPPPVSLPPIAPPPPPVPLPPILQLIPVIITRSQDGGFQAIVIEASNLEPSEPTTVFIYLSSTEGPDPRGHAYGLRDQSNFQQQQQQLVSSQTPAGSVATSNVAYSYPTTSISTGGTTALGNGLPTVQSIQNQVYSQLQSPTRTGISTSTRLSALQNTITQRVVSTLAAQGISVPIATAAGRAAATTAVATAGNATASATAAGQAAVATAVASGVTVSASAIGNAAAAAAGQAVAIAIASSPEIVQSLPNMPPMPQQRPIFKRQRVTLTASDAGTIRHVVRVRQAVQGQPLHGFVIIFGHRSKRHSGRKSFSI